jgi:hypothetical protein
MPNLFIIGDHAVQIAIGRGDQPYIDSFGLRTPEPLKLPFLQRAQQFRLELDRDIADLIQEQGAAVRQFEPARLGSESAGEGATLVPKEFAFQQAAWNSGTVELHHGSLAAAAQLMDGARDELFSGPGFTQQEDGRIAGCDGFDQIEDMAQGSALPNDALKERLAEDLLVQVDILIGARRHSESRTRIAGIAFVPVEKGNILLAHDRSSRKCIFEIPDNTMPPPSDEDTP